MPRAACRAVGVRVAAVGVTTVDELAAVRDHGIPWAQGALHAPARRRPSMLGVLRPVDLLPRIRADAPSPVPRTEPAPLPTLADLRHSAA